MRPIFMLFFALILSGCAAVVGSPPKPESLLTTINSLDAKTLADRIKTYNDKTASNDQRKIIRNEIIDSDISQIDKGYSEFKSKLR